MISIVDLLLQADQYNGHYQTELTKARYPDLVQIMIELEKRFGKPCELRVDSEGGGTIYICDVWQNGENGHHRDQMVVSIKTIDFSDQNASY